VIFFIITALIISRGAKASHKAFWIFFVLIGFSVKFGEVADALPLLLSIVAVAVIGKLVGSYLPARAWGYGQNESIAIGSMMMGKGAMELVFARIALEEKISALEGGAVPFSADDHLEIGAPERRLAHSGRQGRPGQATDVVVTLKSRCRMGTSRGRLS
jgi:hypothetical protein